MTAVQMQSLAVAGHHMRQQLMIEESKRPHDRFLKHKIYFATIMYYKNCLLSATLCFNHYYYVLRFDNNNNKWSK